MWSWTQTSKFTLVYLQWESKKIDEALRPMTKTRPWVHLRVQKPNIREKHAGNYKSAGNVTQKLQKWIRQFETANGNTQLPHPITISPQGTFSTPFISLINETSTQRNFLVCENENSKEHLFNFSHWKRNLILMFCE